MLYEVITVDGCRARLLHHFVEQRLRDHALREQVLVARELLLCGIVDLFVIRRRAAREREVVLHGFQMRAFARQFRIAFIDQKCEFHVVELHQQIAGLDPRITSYNVCYTKLLRNSMPGVNDSGAG